MDKKTKKTNITKTRLTSDHQAKSELEVKKEFLHKLIDNITAADYVEATTRYIDVAGKTQQIHQIVIEKNGNIIVHHKTPRFDHLDED